MKLVAATAQVLSSLILMSHSHAETSAASPADADPFLWLEDVQGERALGWVRERNAISRKELTARGSAALDKRRGRCSIGTSCSTP